jgi:hypothetical protein
MRPLPRLYGRFEGVFVKDTNPIKYYHNIIYNVIMASNILWCKSRARVVRLVLFVGEAGLPWVLPHLRVASPPTCATSRPHSSSMRFPMT